MCLTVVAVSPKGLEVLPQDVELSLQAREMSPNGLAVLPEGAAMLLQRVELSSQAAEVSSNGLAMVVQGTWGLISQQKESFVMVMI